MPKCHLFMNGQGFQREVTQADAGEQEELGMRRETAWWEAGIPAS